jgi:hypothetical protein
MCAGEAHTLLLAIGKVIFNVEAKDLPNIDALVAEQERSCSIL